jgi:UDP-N-acetylmuramoyl-tripeptide--D-alanyl-D-alanine ligase
MAFDSNWIGDALSISPRFSRTYSSITTDSRKAGPGTLFVALPGDHFDGHAYIESAVKAGAEAVIGTNGKIPSGLPADVEVFAVGDSLEAYRTLAHAWRKQFTFPVIAVAGSVGKTTTKEFLAAILRGRFTTVVSTVGSQNGYVGIPMTLLSIPKNAEIAVIEVGIDEPGAMIKHLSLVEPTHSCLTAIGPEHLEKLIDLETVAQEEGLALTIPAKNGATVVVRLDDPWISKILKDLPLDSNLWTCAAGSSTEKALIDKSVRGEYLADKEALHVILSDGSGYELRMPLPGAHNAANLLVAVTIARSLGFSPIETQRGLATFQGAAGRSELRVLPGGTPVLCDYYNANPTSVEAGLDLLLSVANRHHVKKKIVVLGDMLELGEKEEAYHRGLAPKLLSTGVDSIFLYGERMRWLFDELKKNSVKAQVGHFLSHSELAEVLSREAHVGDALLIKGSRGMKMEEVWKIVEPLLIAESTVGSA